MHRDDLLNGQIDILALLQELDEYILIKMDDFFPKYSPGSDIDIVVFDREESLRRVVKYYNDHIGNKGELRITDSEGHCHTDFLFDGELDLRVDLIDNFYFFQNISVKPAYLTKLFLDRCTIRFGEYEVYIPSPEAELTLRYFEFLEWFDRRPDKIKHLDYICAVEDEAIKQRFLRIAHQYIQFKRKTWPSDLPIGYQGEFPVYKMKSRRQAIRQIMYSLGYLISVTLEQWKSFLCK